MPQDQQAASPSIIPGVHHPQFEDDNPNFWRDAVSSYDNPNYVKGMNVDNPKYENSEPPAFIKQGLDMSKVTQPVKKPENEDESNSIAVTYSDKPYEVNVFHPEDYGNSVRNHELTHTFQFTRAIAPKEVGKLGATVNTPEQYKYGWVQGLEEAQKNHKTVSDFNLEQQADMVSDYKNIHDMYLDKAKKGKITPEDERLMYRAQKAYHPFVSQLSKMPAKKDQVTTNPLLQLLGYAKSPTINTKPEPPGLPSYDTPGLGVLPADPLMGGQSQSTVKPSTVEPNKVLQDVLQKNPGLAKNFNLNNTSVVFATGDRAKRGSKERGGLEYWDSSDAGSKDFPSPHPGKNVLEIYSDDLKKNPELLKQAVYGDLMHGLSKDPYWKGLRNEFMQSFTPQELDRQKQKKTWWEDVNGSQKQFDPTYDAYIRGWLADEGHGHQGQKESNNTMYSPKQLQVLQEMQDYLSKGPPKAKGLSNSLGKKK